MQMDILWVQVNTEVKELASTTLYKVQGLDDEANAYLEEKAAELDRRASTPALTAG